MPDTLKNIEIIENYYEAKLTQKERHDFEVRLISDSDFKEEYDLYLNIIEGIKESGKQKLKEKLRLADVDLDKKNSIVNPLPSPKKNYSFYAIAASIILLIGFFFIWTNSNDLPALADKYYEKEKGLPVEMGASENKMQLIMNEFKTGNLTTALENLHKLMLEKQNNDTLEYFNGVICLELKQYDASYASFHGISDQSTFFEKAQYRMIIIDLMENKKQDVLMLINENLERKDGLYYDKLVSLKKELSN